MVKFKQETSGTKPFLWIREEWDDNVEKTTVKTETGKVKIDSEMVILKGTETPEQFMFWFKDYEDKILHNTRTTNVDRVNVLKRIVSKEAQVTVMNAVSLFEKAKDKNDIDSFKNHKVKETMRTYSDGELLKYFDNTDANYTNNRLEDTINESIYHLKIKIFGADRLGLSSYIQLKRVARQMRVTSLGVRAYDTRLSDFQEYLPRCLWVAGEARGLEPTAFNEDDKRELIESALPPAYLTKLAEIGWDLQEKDYDESISKLESLEPGIKREYENQKKIDAATKSNTITNGNKRSGGGDKNKQFNHNGNKNGNQSSNCPICKKHHKGKCWFGPGGEKNNNNNGYNKNKNKNKNFLTSKDAKQMMKTMIASSKNNDSDSDSGDASWRANLSDAEQMHVLATAGISPDDEQIEFDDDELKKYKKQAKKWSKSNKRKRK
jgi:hypothetical protein